MHSREFTKAIRGFSLIEVMVTLCLLSLGIVMIHQSLLSSLNTITFLSNRLNAGFELGNRLWEIEESLKSAKDIAQLPKSVRSLSNGLDFDCTFDAKELDASKKLYQIQATLSWLEQGRNKRLVRSAYWIL